MKGVAATLCLLLVVVPLLVAPDASAATLVAVVTSPTSVELSWTPECVILQSGPPCNNQQTERYNIHLKNGSYAAPWELVETIDNPAVILYDVIGLQPETWYQFMVTEESGWFGLYLESNIVSVTTGSTPPPPPPPNQRPNLTIVRPRSGSSFQAGSIVTIEWTVSDTEDAAENLVVYLNYTGPAHGVVAGPLSGRTTRLTWTVPSSLQGSGFRIAGMAIDDRGGWRVAESEEFRITPGPEDPGTSGGDSLLWQVVSALLTVAVAGLTAGLLLVMRVQLSDWYRRRRERRKQKSPKVGPSTTELPPPP